MFNPFGGMNQQFQGMNIMNRFQQFCQQFQGDPQQKIKELMDSGKVSKQQYDNAVQMAQQFKWMMGGK